MSGAHRAAGRKGRVSMHTPDGETCVYRTSRYNFALPSGGDVVLYNARTGSILRWSGLDARWLAQELCRQHTVVPAGVLPSTLMEPLEAGGFLVPSGTDELRDIQTRFHQARQETPIALTLTTTLDCNLGCYYCYEERSQQQLSLRDVGEVVHIARERIARSRKKSLHVDWYGGEPLMNLEFMEAASLALQALCDRERVTYS